MSRDPFDYSQDGETATILTYVCLLGLTALVTLAHLVWG